eukprot:TRINITY_DN1643_c0_g2_i3.p1 TRINITY_DN1643_c0_g2~~TRINITY_DN1643_c0_g2_i3.p1  ORF type:complete len:587 (-),score=101.46 TRINITY_DN1643_c0_g2_i3:101-1861(-)
MMVKLAIFSLFLSIALAQGLSCSVPTFDGPTTALLDLPTVRTCMESITPNLQSATIDTVSKIMKMYAFRDIVKDSPDDGVDGLLHIQTDLDAAFETIAQTSYEFDYQFQEAVSRVYKGLKDPHTLYKKPPNCYGFNVVQPFVLSSYVDTNQTQQIFVKGLSPYASAFEYQLGINLTQYVNQTILALQSDDPFDYLLTFSILHGFISKDSGSLFNYALKSQYQTRRLVLDDLPQNDFVVYSFEEGDLEVPWLAVSPVAPLWIGPGCYDMKRDHEEISLHTSDHQTDRANLKPLYSSDQIESYLYSPDVVVISIESFEPADNSDFMKVAINTLQFAQKNSVNFMILDLRGNGGGDICLGYQLIDALMEESNPYGKYDIIHSPLMDQVVSVVSEPQFNQSFLAPATWDDPQTNLPFTNSSWYFPGNTWERGNSTSQYSSFIHLACDNYTSPVRYLFKKILILTDGLCGSTCAVFSSHLAEADHVETVVVGGVYNQSQQYYSFPGGEVMHIGDFLQVLQPLNINDPTIVPNPLTNRADVSFTLQEIYPWRKDNVPGTLPLEFHYRPATFRIPMWDYTTDELYDAVAQFFN